MKNEDYGVALLDCTWDDVRKIIEKILFVQFTISNVSRKHMVYNLRRIYRMNECELMMDEGIEEGRC